MALASPFTLKTMSKDERWRGRMPFRLNRRILRTEPLEQQGRGGEPSLAHFCRQMDRVNRFHEQGRGKAEGSFTERIRQEFRAWQKRNGLDWHSPLSFDYRLYRHRTVRITLTSPHIFHRRLCGNGSKGFVLTGEVLSINGLRPGGMNKRGEFALNRIVGHHPVRLLAETATAGSGIQKTADTGNERSECQ